MAFSTDGIRGPFNESPMLPDLILKFAMAIGIFAIKSKGSDCSKPKIVIAKDTRISSNLLESLLLSGIASVGVDVILSGILPTAAVSFLVRKMRAEYGIMISASHNLYQDNGLKIFDKLGLKISNQDEQDLWDFIKKSDLNTHLVKSDMLGSILNESSSSYSSYLDYIKDFASSRQSSRMNVVLDAANGAGYKIAQHAILESVNVELRSIACSPDGFNINEECGSTAMKLLQTQVLFMGFDIGIALDGDADRVSVCDECGVLVSMDHVIATIALHMKKTNLLKGGIVITEASNSALEDFLNQNDIKVYYSKIGDKNVAKLMQEIGCNLGAERSGHIIFGDHSFISDGIISACKILSIVNQPGKVASDIFRCFRLYPEIQYNYRYNNNEDPTANKVTQERLNSLKEKNPDVRFLIRKSGTEKVIRILLEIKKHVNTNSRLERLRDEVLECFQNT